MRAFLLHAVASLAVPLNQWPFSWDTLPTFAFPGAAPRFMTAAEEAYFSKLCPLTDGRGGAASSRHNQSL